MKQEFAKQLKVNPELTTRVLTAFIRDEVEKAGFRKVILGLSGGIDSALVAYLAVRALGKDNVHAVLLPYKTSSPSSLADAQAVVDDLAVHHLVVPITTPVDAYFETLDRLLGEEAVPLRRGNRMARERMSTLFDLSAYYGALVLGTSNKTELLLGYGTQFGDMASALNPIGDLYKHQVRQISEFVGVPDSILKKAPSADLWESQTDEGELGFGYDEADEILVQLVDLRKDARKLVDEGYDAALVELLTTRIRRNQYKRQPPVIAKVSTRTVGIDFRYLRDWGL
ncbi:NAD+ synthase [Alicyclobacillus sp. SO9]|uniref:NAD+ synthase n=1 Tax=Alicyclobacillus sp. SO9 TaxID=2665646 RepID=UPI0018E8E7F4|nr:NAD+ synthase [Alicyclobacillus sp. SO9]QQE81356.1 NAD+ synthase [Alicyclobacillus sp. SO9]